jgi:hypothetical protein
LSDKHGIVDACEAFNTLRVRNGLEPISEQCMRDEITRMGSKTVKTPTGCMQSRKEESKWKAGRLAGMTELELRMKAYEDKIVKHGDVISAAQLIQTDMEAAVSLGRPDGLTAFDPHGIAYWDENTQHVRLPIGMKTPSKRNAADLSFPTRAELKAGWRVIDTEGEGEDTDAAIAAAAAAYNMVPIDDEMNSMGGPTGSEILRLGQGDKTTGPEHLRPGLRTRLKTLGLSTYGNSAVLRQRLAEKLGRELPAGYIEWKPHPPAPSGQQPEAAAQAAAARARAPAAAAAPQLKRRRRRGGPRLAAGPR